MRKNKGFSLVELIIVIAIMAILVGVMAPQLIKYIEKSKVSADTQSADSVHTAIVTAMLDPEVAQDSAYDANVSNIQGAIGEGATFGAGLLGSTANEILGGSTPSLKSNGHSGYSVQISNSTVIVTLPGTDSTGKKAGSPNIVVK
ncbi:MAG: type II secretion system protein [Lachnospiraceae bacterium]|nr:type II secretion system protein [Lachnospiraceae bacterium]